MNSPVTLPNATVGQNYTANLAQLTNLKGGVPPYSFSLNSGSSLPTGLSLQSSGVVTGTPSGVGSSTFGFTVADSSGAAIMTKQGEIYAKNADFISTDSDVIASVQK